MAKVDTWKPGRGQGRWTPTPARHSPCSSYGSLGSSATSSALLGVSWSSLVTNMIRSFPSVWRTEGEMFHPGAVNQP